MAGPRWGAAARMLATVVGGVLAALFCVTTSASAATSIDCTPMGDPACRNLTPTVACVWANPNGTRTVVFGYDNPSTSTLHIDPGAHNGISPGANDQGQPLDFAPGTYPNAFVVTVPAGTWPSWRLGNNSVSASSSTPACPGNPVPVIGSLKALALGLALLLGTVLGLMLTRSRPLVPVQAVRQ